MLACRVDDKPSDTLVAGLRLKVLDGEFDSPPSPPLSLRPAKITISTLIRREDEVLHDFPAILVPIRGITLSVSAGPAP